MNIKDFVFLISDETAIENFFHGYCFMGDDYIAGEQGKDQFESCTGRYIGFGHDGCYVRVNRLADGRIRFDSDWFGYKKLFFFFNGSKWAVSNSIIAIGDYLKTNGYKLVANYHQLSAIKRNKGAIANQLFSFETFIRDIHFVPIGHALIISKTSWEFVNEWQRLLHRSSSYIGMDSYLLRWISRFRTLLNDERLRLGLDISGGVDSRAVFGIFMQAARSMGVDINKRVRFNNYTIGGRNSADEDVARQIADIYGIQLNGANLRKRGDWLEPEKAYQVWKYLNLGIYHPIYFPRNEIDPNIISFGGGGGECFRPFYANMEKATTFEEDFGRRQAVHPEFRYAIVADLNNAMRFIDSCDNAFDGLIKHYQNFRNRIHVGRPMQIQHNFMPLGSRGMYKIARGVPSEDVASGRLLYEVMKSTDAMLLLIPFDDPRKNPTEDVRKRLKHVSEIVGTGRLGNVYGVNRDPAMVSKVVGKSLRDGKEWREEVFGLLHAEFTNAAANADVLNFFGEEMVASARKTLETAVERGKFGHAIEGINISAILCANYVLRD